MMFKQYAPGLVIAALLLGAGFYYSKYLDSGFIEEVPGTDRGVVKGYDYNDLRLVPLDEKALKYYLKGEIELALQTYDKIIARAENEPNAHYGRGVCLLFLQNLDEAEKSFRRALELAPNTPPALVGMGSVESWRDNSEKSIEYYKQALTVWPNYAVAHEFVADEYFRIEQYDLAQVHYKKVTELIPGTETAEASQRQIDVIKMNRDNKPGS